MTTSPFSYAVTLHRTAGTRALLAVTANRSRERAARRHDMRFVNLGSYLLFRDVGLRGRLPDGAEDPTWRGRNGERNALFANSWLRPVCGCPRAAACCSPIFRVRRTPACVRSRSTFPARSPKADDRAAFASPAGS